MESTYERLRDLIVSGRIEVDDRVSEAELASRLSVSRTPVREALHRLEGDGLVQARGRGVRVVRLDPSGLEYVHRTRAALEALTAEAAAERHAAGRLAPAALTDVEELAAAADAATRAGRLDDAVRLNRSFHEAIARLSGNPVALSLLERLWDQIVVSTRRSLRPPARVAVVDAEHRQILERIRAGHSDAGAAARDHVLGTLAALQAADLREHS